MSSVKETYTSADLAKILKITRQTLWKRGQNDGWKTIIKPKRLGGNDYPYETLPPDVKAAIARHEAAQVPQKVLGNAVIPDWSHRIGLARFQVVSEWRAYCLKQKARGIKKAEGTETFLTAYNSGLLCKKAFEVIGAVRKSSLYSWDLTLRESGDDYYQICDKRGKWQQGGKKGLGQLSPEAQEAFLSAWLTPNQPSRQLAYRCMEIALEKIGQEKPSLSTVYRFAERFQENHYDLVVLMREGEKALNDKVLNWIRRDRRVLNVGDCIFADGHVLNFECLHPETGKPFRPTMILWFDWKSGMPVGWEFMPTENTISVSSALRMAIRTLGMVPKVVYLDNGKAFKNKYFNQTNPDFEILTGLYARLGIAAQYATPYKGQVKIIERFFGSFNEQFARLMPSYVGRHIDEKPAYRKRNEKFHRDRHAGAFIPTLREAGEIFAAYVNWFKDTANPDIQNKTCWEILLEGRGPGLDMTEIDRQMLWTKVVTPERSGFTLAGRRYVADSLNGLKCKVVVKYSWADLSVAYLYDQEGRSLGSAHAQIAHHPLAKIFGTEHDQAMVAEANRKIALQKKETMQKARLLDKTLSVLPGQQQLEYNYVPERQEPLMLEGPLEEEALTDGDRAELEALATAALANKQDNAHERPAYFDSQMDRYDWLLLAWLTEGYQPSEDEFSFMRDYEASGEYQVVGSRFEAIKRQYGQRPTGVAA